MVCHGMTWYGMVLDGMRKLTNNEAGVMAYSDTGERIRAKVVENEPMRVVQPKRERVCARRRLMRKPVAKKENVAGTSRRG